MTEDITTLSYSLYHNKGIYALFLGSGISRPAGILTGWEILKDQVEQLAVLHKEPVSGHLMDWYRGKFGKEPDYSDILEELTSTPAERVNALKKYFEPSTEEQENHQKQPTAAHRQIAKLVKNGYIKVIVTTNFDRLLENALKAENIEAVVISNPEQVENVQPLIHNSITIVKVNGDYLETKFLNIKSELSGYDERQNSLLKNIFENFGLITCGWSATWDHALITLLKSANKFRYGNYFTSRGEPGDELKALAAVRNGTLLQISDADSFFTSLSDNLEAIADLHLNHPFTKAIGVSRLKKFIASDEGRVQLHDMVMSEDERALEQLAARPFPDATGETLKNEMEVVHIKFETLAALLAHGIYWGTPKHHQLWLKVFSASLYEDNRTTGLWMWSKFKSYPAFYLFYVLGASAVIAKDFILLAQLLNYRFFSPGQREEVWVIEELNNKKIIDERHTQALGLSRQMPISRYMLDKMKTVFRDLVVNELLIEEAVDYFEYTLSLTYLTNVDSESIPLGYFAMKINDSGFRKACIVTRKQQEAEKLKDQFELANNSLFETYALYQKADDTFKAFISGMRFF